MKKTKVRLVYLYEDKDISPVVLKDNGKPFEKLYEAFKVQDDAMANEVNQDGKAHKEWLDFTEFMKKNGVDVLEATVDNL